MANKQDIEDRKLSLNLFLGLVAVIAIAGAGIFFIAGPSIVAATAPGLGLKSAAIIAFVMAMILAIVLAIASGDGLLGELPFTLLGFFAFFIICWLMLAWIF